MNCEQFEQHLAEYIGGELSAQRHVDMQSHVQACRACAEQARGLQAAAAVLEANGPSEAEAASAAGRLDLSQIVARAEEPRILFLRPRLGFTVVRYAVVIALAFGAGYVARQWQTSAGVSTTPPDTIATAVSPGWTETFQRATTEFPSAPSFSHALLSLARR